MGFVRWCEAFQTCNASIVFVPGVWFSLRMHLGTFYILMQCFRKDGMWAFVRMARRKGVDLTVPQ